MKNHTHKLIWYQGDYSGLILICSDPQCNFEIGLEKVRSLVEAHLTRRAPDRAKSAVKKSSSVARRSPKRRGK